MADLPIESLRVDFYNALSQGVSKFVVSAPTASGKSTRLPHILWQSGKINGKIIVMQPRRVAARMLAKAVKSIFNLNDEVGWHVRFDKHYTDSSKIVFVTEGILAKMILSDDELKGVGAIIFDEFHERNIYADISLALALKVKKQRRPDIVLTVCSASMDSDSIINYLGEGTKKFECSGRLYPVDIEYSPPKNRDIPVWENAVSVFERLVRNKSDGNFLIFMAGAYEISKTVKRLLESPASKGFDVYALHGELPPQQQDAILSAKSRPKVIVSTNIAETSLTIEGVRFVIDSGFARVARFDVSRGVNTLLTERISMASATQRAGRAGRLESGRAIRLWRESEEESFEQFISPEIKRLDLSQILLWLKSAGIKLQELDLFECPSNEQVTRAERSLYELGALKSDGTVTRAGHLMADFPASPRYARLLIEGAFEDCIYESAMLAALDEVGRIKLPIENAFKEAQRDELCLCSTSEPQELITLCIEARRNSFREDFCREFGIHSSNARKVCVIADELTRIAKNRLKDIKPKTLERSLGERIARCVLGAFSDNLGVRLNKGTLACRFTNSRKGEIRKDSRNWAKDIFVAMSMKEQNVSGGVAIMASLIVPVEIQWLKDLFADDFSEKIETVYSPEHKRIVTKKSVRFRDIVLVDEISYKVSGDESAKLLRDEILAGNLELKNFDDTAKNFIERVNFVSKICPDSNISAIDETTLSEIYEQMCFGKTSYSEVKNADVLSALHDWLSPEQLSYLNYMAPRFIQLPSRRKPIEVRYDVVFSKAVVSSYFKDFFDFNPDKIKICDGKIPITCELLSPRGIPIQTTSDLLNFWNTGWANVKKELKARYPKHIKPTDIR